MSNLIADCHGACAQARQNNARWTPAQACQRLPEPWSEVVAAHSQCLAEVQSGRHTEAYAAITSAVQPFIKVRHGWAHKIDCLICVSNELSE